MDRGQEVKSEDEEAAERIDELQFDLIHDFNQAMHREKVTGFRALPYGKDILVTAPLSKIIEWAHDWRSEIEELGE